MPITQAKASVKREAKAKEKCEGKEEGGVKTSSSSVPDYPCRITSSDYFRACPFGEFFQKGLLASEANIELLLTLEREDASIGKTASDADVTLSKFNYFSFDGNPEQLWNHVVFARLAFEGFFTITTRRRGGVSPLPELQPYYGVVDWDNFNTAKHVKKTLRKLRRTWPDNPSSPPPYRLFNNRDPAKVFEKLDCYQKQQHWSNWLTPEYYATMKLASEDNTINFKVHCIELYSTSTDGSSDVLVAGEIGYSVGRVYTSLSGFTTRNTAGSGTIQVHNILALSNAMVIIHYRSMI
jgi:hypothetical protein